MNFVLRPALPTDIKTISELIMELAIFERMQDECISTPEILSESLFPKNNNPKVYVLIAEEIETKQVGGFCLYFNNFSTFTGKPGLYLEDLYVREKYRRNGLGKMFFNELKRIARETGCSRMEWSVLNWNTPAREFYTKTMNAEEMNEWTICRLAGETLN
jgi:GNAT superfamily N-acetyltransferase